MEEARKAFAVFLIEHTNTSTPQLYSPALLISSIVSLISCVARADTDGQDRDIGTGI